MHERTHKNAQRMEGLVTDRERMAMAQGIYFLGTGVWPLAHMASFEAVTGPKIDKWLVRTVGVLVSIVGGVLVSAAARGRVTGEIAALGALSAAGVGLIDTVYASRGRIADSYITDAAAEAIIVAGWAVALRDKPATAAA
jgi:hypothetical protein